MCGEPLPLNFTICIFFRACDMGEKRKTGKRRMERGRERGRGERRGMRKKGEREEGKDKRGKGQGERRETEKGKAKEIKIFIAPERPLLLHVLCATAERSPERCVVVSLNFHDCRVPAALVIFEDLCDRCALRFFRGCRFRPVPHVDRGVRRATIQHEPARALVRVSFLFLFFIYFILFYIFFAILSLNWMYCFAKTFSFIHVMVI